MCYVLGAKQTDGESVILCYFHDKEMADEVVDRLECENFMTDYEVFPFSTYEVRRQHIPYCKEYLQDIGFLSAKKE